MVSAIKIYHGNKHFKVIIDHGDCQKIITLKN